MIIKRMSSRPKSYDKYAKSCYRDQVSTISSYRCKRNPDFVGELPVLKGDDAEKKLWLDIIAWKEKDIQRELRTNILECQRSLTESNEKLSLTLDQVIPILKAVRRLIDYRTTRTLKWAWKRFTSRLNDIRVDTKKTSAAIVLQSKWRRKMMRKQFAATMITIIRIQCLARKFIARRRLGGLKKRRMEALLVREQLVRAYVARCQRKKRKEKRIQDLGLMREKALRDHMARYKSRKLLQELEHNAAITCQAAFREYIGKQQLQIKE